MPEKFGRELAYKIACESGNEICLNDTYILAHLYIDHDRKYPGFEEQILCNGLRGTGKNGEYNELFEKTPKEKNSDLKSIFINALGCTDDTVLLEQFLKSSLHDENYSTSERRAIFNAAFNSHSGFSVILKFTNEHESEMIAAYNWNKERILLNIARNVFMVEEFIDFADLINDFDDELSIRIISESLINLNAQSLPKNVEQMQFIKKYLNIDDPDTTTRAITTTTTNPSPTTTIQSGSIIKISNFILAIAFAFILKM
jgi:ERAP1-like C-terminal domain